MTAERWRVIPGWSRYQVSDLGNVRNRRTGKPLKPYRPKNRYWHVTLCGPRGHWAVAVHQLAMLACVGPCPDGHEVLHGRRGKDDDRLASLRYGSHAENAKQFARDRQQILEPYRPTVLTGQQMSFRLRRCCVVVGHDDPTKEPPVDSDAVRRWGWQPVSGLVP